MKQLLIDAKQLYPPRSCCCLAIAVLGIDFYRECTFAVAERVHLAGQTNTAFNRFASAVC